YGCSFGSPSPPRAACNGLTRGSSGFERNEIQRKTQKPREVSGEHLTLRQDRRQENQGDVAARSAALRRTQNSFPSGSARMTHPEPSGFRWSATRAAPRPSSRATSSSRDVSGRRHRWTRFLTVF